MSVTMTKSKVVAVPEMLSAVQKGERRLFRASRSGTRPSRFRVVMESAHYALPRIEWRNSPGLAELPSPALHGIPYTPLQAVLPIKAAFDGPVSDLLDFYRCGTVYLLSERLHGLVQSLDAAAIEAERISVTVAGESPVSFWAVIPARVLDVVDTTATDIAIKSVIIGGQHKIKHVSFPDGVVYREFDIDPSVYAFVDYYDRRWLWSDRLIDAAKEAAARGISAERAVGPLEYVTL